MIYKALDHDGKILGVVLASSEGLAKAFWHGQDIIPSHIDELWDDALKNHPTGVIPIVNTFETQLYINGDYITGRAIGE